MLFIVDPVSIGFPKRISLKIILNNGMRNTKTGRIRKRLTNVNTIITSKFGKGCIPKLTRINRLNVPISINIHMSIRSNENECVSLFFIENNGLFIY
jgi:hypothetical protein